MRAENSKTLSCSLVDRSTATQVGRLLIPPRHRLSGRTRDGRRRQY